MKKLLIINLLFVACLAYAQDNLQYQRPPEEIAQLVEAPLTPLVTFSPDRNWMVFLERSDYPSIEELSRPELRLAGMRINPNNYGPSRRNNFIGISMQKMGSNDKLSIKGLPQPLLLSNASFSPDSRKVAFLQNNPDKIELWIIDVATLQASKATERKVNDVFGSTMTWTSDSQYIIFSAVPQQSGSMPEASRVPAGPVIEENLGRKAPSRTYQDLLKNAYDEALFEHYASSELVKLDMSGNETVIAAKDMYGGFSTSPDGQLLMLRSLHKPFSYLVPASRFPTLVKIIDLDGKEIKTLIDIPLLDNIPSGFNATQAGPRSHAWRADKPRSIYWVEAQDGGDPRKQVEIRDIVYSLDFPFTGTATELIKLPNRYSNIVWGNENIAWVYERWWSNRKEVVYQINPTKPGTPKVVFDRNYEDNYNAPGSPVTTQNQFGRYVMLINKDNSIFLTGQGASPEGNRPFLNKMLLANGRTTTLWRSEAPYYESFVTMLDPRKGTFVTSRESNTENPNYYLRTAGSNKLTKLTDFAHPYPQLKEVHKEVLKYTRKDGVELSATLYLPAGYKKEDGPLPGLVWAYPREFKSADAAGQVSSSPHTFTRLSWGGPIYWVTRGYAVLDNAAMPIVGEGDNEPNDTFVEQLIASAQAVVDHAANMGVLDKNRVGVGGHSYGAFMTANLLAHANIFKAGIARSGAYNRTLTPFGFQSEERTYWEAPDVYNRMSPFSHADKINQPILLIHGEADNNSGTFPIQSERLYNAIKGHGGTARYVVLPYESHGYSAKESIMHTLWEMDRWLETYVKGANGSTSSTR
ncbi:MAG TPA: prolyl oligopeptidase family serine peptidase [Cyclobacteriaceae bacterium]|nr:prolyl oligopeptidase family serine peptidase [Cyclobacteriaceae bacterium]